MTTAPPSVRSGPSGESRSVLFVVFTTIFIDFVGFSVLFPVLPLYAERLGATPLEVGLLITIYALAQLAFLPAWGWVSDRVGRRPVILVSLFGTACSFLVLSFAETLTTIYVARGIAGFFAASIATAQAVVTDVTSKAERAKGMGLIGAAFGLAMMVGPMLGGLTSGISESAPFYSVAILAVANLVVAWFRLPESRPADMSTGSLRDFARSLIPTPLRLLAAVHERRIGLYLYLFFHVFTAFAILESLITLYAGMRYGASTFDMGLVFSWIALFLVLTQGVALRRLAPRYGEARLFDAGLLLMALGLAGTAAAPTFEWLYLAGPVTAVGNGLAIPSLTSLYSQACEAEQAGELLGQSQAMATTGRIVGPLVGGLAMQHFWLGTPFVIAAALMLLGLFFFAAARRTLLAR